MNEEVKHCPFCRGKAKLLDWPVENNTHTLYAVVCHNAKCYINPESPYYDTLEEAIEAWNRRANEMSEELKHCPFCGAEAEIHKNVFAEGTVYTVECISCSCGLDWFDTEEEAIKAWNRRFYE